MAVAVAVVLSLPSLEKYSFIPPGLSLARNVVGMQIFCYDVQLTRHEADYLVRKMSTYFTINAAGINYSIQTIQVVPNFYK